MNAAAETEARWPPPDGDSCADGKFWLVVCTESQQIGSLRDGHELLTRGYKYVHESETSANKEAARLATRFKGYAFAVVESMAIVQFDMKKGRLVWDECKIPANRRSPQPEGKPHD